MNARTSSRWSFTRLLPFGIFGIAGVVITGLWLAPSDDFPRVYRVAGTLLTSLAVIGLLALWLLALSGLRWFVRLPLFGLAVLAGAFLLSRVQFDGDLIPFVRWPWERSTDSAVDAHRSRQPKGMIVMDRLSAEPGDWAEYRGPLRDGVVRDGPPLSRDWKAHPPKLVWKQPCGAGWASFAILGDALVTIEQRHDKEAVVCYEAATGREAWVHAYPTEFRETMGGIGPRATPTIADGRVYSLGAEGHLVCLDLVTGNEQWSTDILTDNDNLRWAMSGSPLVVENLVIVNPGAQRPGRDALVAYDKVSGKKVWGAGNTKAGYSSPMLATIAGEQMIVLLDGKELAGYSLDGRKLWNTPWDRTNEDINVAQPLVYDDDRIFITSGYSIGSAMFQISKGPSWTVRELWRSENKPLRCRFTNPVAYGDTIYGLDEGILACIDARDGSLKWKDGRYRNGQLLRWENMLIVMAEYGDLVAVRAAPDGHQELGRVKGALRGERSWNVPAMSNGRIYLRNDGEMACYDLRE